MAEGSPRPPRRGAGLRPLPLVALAVLAALGAPAPARAGGSAEQIGDILQIALPVAAGGSTLLLWDREGFEQFAGSYASSMLMVGIGKPLTSSLRSEEPTARFPSGHTTSAFAGAAFLNRRYGPWVGVPAFAAAAFTGYSRIEAGKHVLDDVMAGAAVGLFSSWAWVSPLPAPVRLTPMEVGTGYGIGFSLPLGADPPAVPEHSDAPVYRAVRSLFGDIRDPQRVVEGGVERAYEESPPVYHPRYRFAFAFGPNWQSSNVVTAPRASGTPIALTRYGGGDASPAISTITRFEVFLDEHHELLGQVSPFQSREAGLPLGTLRFDGLPIPGGLPTDFVSVLDDFRVQYRYRLTHGAWSAALGLGVSLQNWETQVEVLALKQGIRRVTVFPLPHLEARAQLTPRLALLGEINGMYLGSDWTGDGAARLRWQLGPHWDLGLGYRVMARGIDAASAASESWSQLAFVEFGYAFGSRGD